MGSKVADRDPAIVAAEALHDQILERRRAAEEWPFGFPKDTARQETVDHPAHYNANPSGVECITVVEHMPFNVGNAVKYLWRAGEKPGVDAVEDLRKAAWYVAREIERRSKP